MDKLGYDHTGDSIKLPCDVRLGHATFKKDVGFDTLLIGVERNNMYRAEDHATINRLKSENERLQMELAEVNGLLDVGIQQLMQTMRERDQAVNMKDRVTTELMRLCEWLRTSPAIGERADDAAAKFMAAGGVE